MYYASHIDKNINCVLNYTALIEAILTNLNYFQK